MKKYKLIEFIKNNYFVVIFIFLAFITIAYSSIILYYDIKYYGTVYNGKIINKEYYSSEVGDEIDFISINYTIIVNGIDYNGNADKKTDYKINDKVIVQPKGQKSVKILYVNGNKVANKLGLEDFLSILFLSLLILMIVIQIKKRKIRK
jgi:hypothetical protein